MVVLMAVLNSLQAGRMHPIQDIINVQRILMIFRVRIVMRIMVLKVMMMKMNLPRMISHLPIKIHTLIIIMADLPPQKIQVLHHLLRMLVLNPLLLLVVVRIVASIVIRVVRQVLPIQAVKTMDLHRCFP
jgi:hypothetical protein